MSIATLVPDHQLISIFREDGHRRAFCSCEHKLAWKTHVEDHLRHVLDVVWREGYTQGIDDTRIADAVQVDVGLGPALYAQPNRTSPYKEEA